MNKTKLLEILDKNKDGDVNVADLEAYINGNIWKALSVGAISGLVVGFIAGAILI